MILRCQGVITYSNSKTRGTLGTSIFQFDGDEVKSVTYKDEDKDSFVTYKLIISMIDSSKDIIIDFVGDYERGIVLEDIYMLLTSPSIIENKFFKKSSFSEILP